MERKKFLQSVGKGAAFALTFGCFSSCLREELDTKNTDLEAEITEADENQTSTDAPESEPETAPETTAEPETTPEPTPPENAIFTIDLTSAEAKNLADKGGYIIKENIVVAQNTNGEYVAATVVCSHDLLKKMVFKNNEYFCTEHDARFDQTGKGLNSKASKGLKIYETLLSGNTLSVLS